MRKIRIFEHISLDGMMETGEDDAYGGWSAPYRSPVGLEALIEIQGTGFDLLLGRRTYDLWSGYWPKAGNSVMASSLNSATKYVATHRPDSLEWGPFGSLGDDIIEGIKGIKSTDGPDLILWGSSTLTSVLLGQGLVDELVLLVYPVVVGRGKRFFSEGTDPRKFELANTKTMTTGVLINTYRNDGTLRS